MQKKLIAAFLIIVGIGFVGASFLAFLGFFKADLAGIFIETEPKSTVYLNGRKVGNTPYEATKEPGDVVIKLVPDSEDGFDDYETKVTLVSGVKTVIKRTFKATEEETSGAIVSFEKIGGEESLVTVVTIPDNAQIALDNKIAGYAPLRTKINPGDHDLLVSQSGYLDKKLSIRGYKGYKLTAIVKLTKERVEESTPKPVLSESISNLGKIKILDTGVGFLRVRKEPNTAAEVVGQVKPSEVYDLLEENNDWYKIKVTLKADAGETQEFEGWVRGDFVEKIE